MFRVELTESTNYAGEIERISSPAKNDDDIIRLVNNLKKDFKNEIESGKYYIKIAYYKIEN